MAELSEMGTTILLLIAAPDPAVPLAIQTRSEESSEIGARVLISLTAARAVDTGPDKRGSSDIRIFAKWCSGATDT